METWSYVQLARALMKACMKVPTLLALLIGTVEPIFRRLRLATQRDLRTQRPPVTADGQAELHKARGISLVALVLGLVSQQPVFCGA